MLRILCLTLALAVCDAPEATVPSETLKVTGQTTYASPDGDELSMRAVIQDAPRALQAEIDRIARETCRGPYTRVAAGDLRARYGDGRRAMQLEQEAFVRCDG